MSIEEYKVSERVMYLYEDKHCSILNSLNFCTD